MSEQKDNKTKPAEQKNDFTDRSRMILETSMDGFCVIGLDGKMLEVNSSLCDILGYSREELLKMNITDIDAIETPEETAQHIDMIMRQGYDRFETKHRCKDGRVIHVEVSSQYCNLDGNKFFFSFFRDITDFWLSMEKLRESHSVYETLCNNIPGMVYRARPDWSTEFIANSEAVCGYSPEDINSNKVKWLDIIHPDDREMVLNDAPQIEASRSITIQEYRIIAKDGSIHWVEDHKSLIFAKKGVFNGVDGIVFDITARKQARNDLQTERNKLDSIIGAMEDSLTIRNLEYEITYQNKVIDDIYGDVRGKKCYQVFEGNDQVCDGCPVKLAFRDGKSHTSVREVAMPSGENVFWETTANPIRDASGKIISCLEMSKNITERKQAEKDLIESERSLAMAQRAARVGSWDWDILNDKLTWSDETYHQLGLKPNEIEATYEAFERFVHPDDLEQLNEVVRAALEENKPYKVEARMIRRDGTEWIMHTQGLIERNDDGKAVRFVGTQQDITERKRTEMEREMYRDGLLKAQRRAYIGSMGSIVAHQVNQPLTKINILLDRAIEQIEEASCSPSALKNVKEGLAEAHEAASIIRKFRQYSKNSALEGTDKVNVSAVADRIVSVLSERAKPANIRISIKDLGDLPAIEANETALEQMFLVLTQNAIEAADGRKPHNLDITGKFAEGNIELQFSDDCCGIAPENLDRIFEPFFSTKAEDKGMGLGLDIVKQILISCGGTIRVDSRLGEGATFYVTLPISNALKS